jgi:formate dehydrogenase iron-sulfur subunit
MFEVSWCVGLYVTILLLEFLPVPFWHFGFQRPPDALRQVERRRTWRRR